MVRYADKNLAADVDRALVQQSTCLPHEPRHRVFEGEQSVGSLVLSHPRDNLQGEQR